MLEFQVPEPLMLTLRWLLLIGPIGLVLCCIFLRERSERTKIGAFFAFLYGVPMIFITHAIALEFGWWRYGWDALMLNGIPADILIGGAVLFGPGLFLAFPRVQPIMLCLPIIIGLHATIFSSLEPLVFAGQNWFFGVIFVFVIAHIPAIYLAKWTAEDRHLPMRCAFLAVMTGGMIFAILPSLIMQAMGGEWGLWDRPIWTTILAFVALTVASTIGLAANQMLCLQGEGTPVPLDPTTRLVRSGIYAYVSNPMQLSAALCWVILGLYLQNIWIIAAAGMAWVFVQGMVRWHNRHDIEKRFPEGWPEYKQNVPEWFPRWKPWGAETAQLTLQTDVGFWPKCLKTATGIQIQIVPGKPTYRLKNEPKQFQGLEAQLFALTHVNFVVALVAHAVLLCITTTKYIFFQARAVSRGPV